MEARSGDDRNGYWSALPADQIAGMFERLSDGIVVLGPDGTYRYANERGAEMLDSTANELIGECIWELFPGSEARLRPTYEKVVRDGEPVSLVEYYEPWERWFEQRVHPQDDGIIILFRDVTDRHRVEDELRESGERMAEAEQIVRFGVWKWEIATGKVRWSDQLHRIYGMKPGEFAGTVDGFLEHLHPDDRDRVWGEIGRSMETREPFVFEERIKRKDGEERVLLSEGHPIIAPDGTLKALVGVCHDITDRTTMALALGASERRLRAIVDNTPAVVTVKDLTGRYVMTNAEAGRIFGIPSEVLVGQRCSDVFPAEIADVQRANDVLAAAEDDPVYDEIVLVRDGGPRNFFTITFSLPDEDGHPAETCTIATDVTESREREGERLERTTWTERITSALDEGRMVPFAQPIVDLGTGAAVSNELLARMLTAGERSQVLPPSAFLPAAERYGLIQRIDCWMVRQALALPAPAISQVNLSAVTMCDQRARQEIIGLLEESGGGAERIVFEITETAVPEHLEAALAFGSEVAGLGARLALDDFGTGFGSLTYLNTLPLTYIKIDLSFVRGLCETPENRRLVESIIGIAGVFGLQTIAEGVEDEGTLELLRELGVDFAQGYHLGRPAWLSLPPLEPEAVKAPA